MMVSPANYIDGFRNSDYSELITERNKLLQFIQAFEEDEFTGSRDEDEWMVNPSPEVKYQCYLDYLAKLCALMQKRYNMDYVHEGKRLSELHQELKQ